MTKLAMAMANKTFVAQAQLTMEQYISYIFICYRGHLQKGVAIFYSTGTNF